MYDVLGLVVEWINREIVGTISPVGSRRVLSWFGELDDIIPFEFNYRLDLSIVSILDEVNMNNGIDNDWEDVEATAKIGFIWSYLIWWLS